MGRDGCATGIGEAHRHVSIHAPVWGATPTRSARLACICRFNPRARVGRDLPRPSTPICGRRFNPRARVGRDKLKFQQFDLITQFQSTRPCGARRVLTASSHASPAVSIHAPVWGATTPDRDTRELASVSIHAPVWGATAVQFGHSGSPKSFNPRARVGRDAGASSNFQLHRAVSIHAPVWGATRQDDAIHHSQGVSIHAPVWGATAGRRRLLGRDQVSIHAPVWGATWRLASGTGFRAMFQSTRPCGARHPHHNSLRDKDFFRVIREPMLPLDPKGTGQVAATQKVKEINMLLKCEPSRESHTA